MSFSLIQLDVYGTLVVVLLYIVVAMVDAIKRRTVSP
jgi:hypothetical protein